MNSQYIKRAINDCQSVKEEAVRAINSSKNEVAQAINRTAIASALSAEAMLSIQLEGTIMREAMEEAEASGRSVPPAEMAKILSGI